MTRILVWVAVTVAVLTLLLRYPTSTTPSAPSGTAEPVSGSSRVASPAVRGAAPRTWGGDTVPTQYGPVQVQITVAGARITDVSVLQYPDGNEQDRQISAYALPQLIDETLSAQGSGIDMVSGASYTSQGYIGSLQSALDQAGL
jgi:uncharacterized protein with FMN-binding domain